MNRQTDSSRRPIPPWVLEVPDAVSTWLSRMMCPDRFGLFRECVDAGHPFSLPASNAAVGMLQDLHRWENLPGRTDGAVASLVEFVRSHQQPETGLFIDPHLDPKFAEPDNPAAYLAFRRAVTAYSIELLKRLGAAPTCPYFVTGDAGKPDPQAFLAYLKTADWTKPWGTGSHAAGKARELFFLVNEGHEEYIPAVCAGIEAILAHQNPRTGMWGDETIPLHEQISGALKVIGRFRFSMGFDVPYLDRLADSCIAHHADGSFYAETDDICIPRNVAEMCIASLVHSDYRRDELLATLDSIVNHLQRYRMPDGGFAGNTRGTTEIGWCGARVAGPSASPRGNMTGCQAMVYCLGLVGEYLGWCDLPWRHEGAGWRERVAALRYQIVRTPAGKIEIERIR